MGDILVLGATGTVGRPLVRTLLAAGHPVKAGSRSGKPVEGAPGTAFDFADRATWDAAFAGVDRAYVLAPSGTLDVRGTIEPVVRFAAERKVKVVLQSVIGVDADDDIAYRQVELALEASGTPYVILRPNWFADNFHTYWKAGVERGLIALPAALGKSSFIDARDIAASAASALTTDRFDGQAFNLTGPEALSYAQAAEILSLALGRPISYRAIDDEAFVAMLTEAGVAEAYARLLATIFHPVREGWTALVTDAVETLTGYPPRSLRDYAAHARPALAA
jgi:uncharacterized protein YbjT (DUF2867 family)